MHMLAFLDTRMLAHMCEGVLSSLRVQFARNVGAHSYAEARKHARRLHTLAHECACTRTRTQ